MPAVETSTEQKAYERLDRHIRTAASHRELAHWDAERAGTRLSGAHDAALRKAINARLKVLDWGAK